MVPVSPQYPREIALPALPLTVLQEAAVCSELFSQPLPSRNTGKLRDSPPLWGSLEQLEQPSLAGPSLQVTELAALSTPQETGSLSRLFRSMETTAKCVSMGPAHCKKENIVFSLGLRRQLSTGSFPRWWVPSRLWLWNKKQTPS